MAYDATRAAVFNRLIQLGFSEQEALNQAGISDAEAGNYSVGSNGLIGPLIDGSGAANNLPADPVFRSLYEQQATQGATPFLPAATPGISPFGEADDEFIPPPPTENPGAQTTFDEFGTIVYPTADDGAAFSELPDDNLAFSEGVDPGPGYNTVDPFAFDEPPTENPGAQTTFDEFGNIVYPTADDGAAFSELPDDNLAYTQGVDPGPLYPPSDDGDAFSELPDDDLAYRQGVDPGPGYGVSDDNLAFEPTPVDPQAFDATELEAANTKALLQKAQEQAALQQSLGETARGDWRVRLRLLPGANYLYKAPDADVLKPLLASDGVIFPYTPQIQTSYQAKYDAYDLVHSNYRGYFYRGSSVNEVQITGTFTAQDTREAEYVLAVIHFFRSVTKMFYGKDPLRGAPPPLVQLSGLGQYQFNGHLCVVSNFNYNLPNNVNYIRTTPNNQNLNLTERRSLSATPSSNTLSSITSRLKNAGLPPGATPPRLTLGEVTGVVAGTEQSTYVPTKLEIQITLLPIQTRQQVSQQFSLENFANGNLIKGGFW